MAYGKRGVSMINASKIVSRFIFNQIGKEYKLGSKEKGYTDCFRAVEEYLSFYDIRFPEEYNGYTRDNYGEMFSRDKKEAIRTFVKLIRETLVPSEGINIVGDILVFEDVKYDRGIGVDCGNSHIFYVSDSNGPIIAKKRYLPYLESFKCQLLSQ